MTNDLPDTIRRLYTGPGEYIDCDHPAVRNFAGAAVPSDASDREKASICSIRRCATAPATTLTSTCARARRSGPRACLRPATAIAWARRHSTPPPALLHPFDGAGRTYMQYINDHGTYHDIPAKFLMQEMARDYANMQVEDLSGRDLQQETAGAAK